MADELVKRRANAQASRMTFAPSTDDDFEDLLALRIEAMQESLERLGRFDPARARERFRASFSPQYTRHVSKDEERVGFVAVRPQADGLLLDHLYIRPGFQGQGLGSAVLTCIFAEADAAGLAVTVGALKKSASNRFYVLRGFGKVDEGEWDVYYRRPCPHSSSQPS